MTYCETVESKTIGFAAITAFAITTIVNKKMSPNRIWRVIMERLATAAAAAAAVAAAAAAATETLFRLSGARLSQGVNISIYYSEQIDAKQ